MANAPLTPLIYVKVYRSIPNRLATTVGRPQRWRWSAINGRNFRKLAISSESYTNRDDLVDAVWKLFGDESEVYMREAERGDAQLRLPTAA